MSQCQGSASGDALLAAAMVTSIALSKGKSAQELGVLSTFFSVLGDSLALLALHAPSEADECTEGTQ